MSLGQTLSGFWHSIQADLFPWLEEELGPLGGRYRRFVTVLEFARVESFLPHFRSLPGRPVEDRAALARAFIAKAVFDIPTTRALIERLQVDRTLRRLCGWTYAGEIPSEATFSRAFAEFSASALPARLHEALIEKTLGDHLVGHVSRDATAIEARERPAPKPRAEKPKRKRGRPRKGEERPRELRRVERQLKMTLPQMLDDLPKACAVGTKRSKGFTASSTRGCLMRARSAGLRVATTKASSSQCLQRVRETPIMRPSAAPAFSGSPGGEIPVSRQVRTQKSRNYNDLQWSGTMNNNSWCRNREPTARSAAAAACRRDGRAARTRPPSPRPAPGRAEPNPRSPPWSCPEALD